MLRRKGKKLRLGEAHREPSGGGGGRGRLGWKNYSQNPQDGQRWEDVDHLSIVGDERERGGIGTWKGVGEFDSRNSETQAGIRRT